VPPSYFDSYGRQPIDCIAPEKEERRVFCFEFEVIQFVKRGGNKGMDYIWD
jgi:hypothetical protein